MPDSTTPRSPTDRNLLFGILALQMDFITRDALIAAMHAWVLDKGKPLGQILQDHGDLHREERALLEALVEQHVKRHGNDPAQSLASLSSVSSVRRDLQAVNDPDVHQSLGTVGAQAAHRDPATTADDSKQAGPRFRVLRPHARGGLGEISVAEDLELHREVALKEIQERHADDPHTRGRFLLEAEITGGLEHPGIVPVYSLGSYDDGRPFYAMRFVKGDNLKEAVERFHAADTPGRDAGERSLAFRQLLGRFVDVCNAVAFAHSRGVLHRDLKPGNVMLGKYGETLVVDWGLAKLAGRAATGSEGDEQTLRPPSGSAHEPTRAGAVVGTPGYMSPEQAEGRLDQLGPASDVYSLGATLYYVLTGQNPVEGGDLSAVLARVREGVIVAPRRHKPDVPRALEAVCLKAMALGAEDRYPTALELAADVEHWLADEAVGAWREPWTLRAGRWLRRHRTLVTSSAAVLVAAVALLGGATVLLNAAWDKEYRGRLDAEKAQRKEAAVANFLVEAFRSPDPFQGTREESMANRLDRAAARLDQEFGQDPYTRGVLLDALGMTYLGLGLSEKGIQALEQARNLINSARAPGHPDALITMNNLAAAYRNAGRHKDSLLLIEETLELGRAAFGPDHAHMFTIMQNLALAYQDAGRLAEAMPLFEETLKLQRVRLGPDHVDTLHTMHNLAEAYRVAGRLAEALPLVETAVKFRGLKLGPDHPATLSSRHVLAAVHLGIGRYVDAVPQFEETLKLRKAKLGFDHPDTFTSMSGLAEAYRGAGRLADSLAILEETLKLRRAKLGSDHDATLATMNNLAGAYKDAGRLADALSLHEETRKVTRAKFGPDHLYALISTNNLASTYQAVDRHAEALPLLEESLKLLKAKFGPNHPNTLITMNNLATSYRETGKLSQAKELVREAFERGRDNLPPESPLRLQLLANFGSLLLGQGKFAEAEQPLRECLVIREKTQPDHWSHFQVQSFLGECLTGQKKYAEAEPLLLSGYEGMKARVEQIPAPGRMNLPRAAEHLVKLYDAWGKPDEANKWLRTRESLPPPTKPKPPAK